VEFCSGFLRQAVMKQYRLYAKAIGDDGGFVYQNWGMLLCVAGILGGVFAGFISDHVFGSRRGPVSSVLYAGLFVGALGACFTVGQAALGWFVVFMSLCVIGVHGMLSGTASMDFGGKKNAGVVTGIIDGFVYLGSGAQAFFYGVTLPKNAKGATCALPGAAKAAKPLWSTHGSLCDAQPTPTPPPAASTPATTTAATAAESPKAATVAIDPHACPATVPANWAIWPEAMVPVAVIGLVLCATIWNARPQSASAAKH
jgi:hypothetical protein